ncbi:S-layer homology domain-containing protein [Citricoccus nitrophenolicus]|uniref:S-layer homology domain-containing protein n=1 Tax=Citricoccus nitrophenolicus TaxID=863575 RepID=A0ABV0IHQ2_9MICC
MTKKRRSLIAFLASLIAIFLVTSGSPAVAQPSADAEGPVLVEYSVSPDSWDFQNGALTVEVTARIKDATGTFTPHVQLSHTAGQVFEDGGDMELIQGDERDGLWQTSFQVGSYVYSGQWMVVITLRDVLGNWTGAGITELETIQLVGGDGADIFHPLLQEVWITPQEASFEDGPVELVVRARMTDDTGVVVGPTVSINNGPYSVNPSRATLVEGDALDGIWESRATIPATAPDGNWRVSVRSGRDAAYNYGTRGTSQEVAISGGSYFSGAFDVQVTGTDRVGNHLTANPSELSPSPDRVEFQWISNGTDLEGENDKTLMLDESHLHNFIEVRVSAFKTGYRSISTTVGASALVETGLLTPGIPEIVGVPAVGQTLTANAGTWTPEGAKLAYQWNADSTPIQGATDTTLTLTTDHIGKTITVTITGTKNGYETASETSDPTGKVAAGTLTTATPAITGDAKLGSKLTANAGTWAPEGVKLAYQWNADGTPIQGATDTTLTLTTDHIGKTITVTITGTKNGYETASETSDPTGKVALPEEPVRPVEFSDVSENQWFYAPVNWMVQRQITTGYKNGTFQPAKSVSRGEAVTFLYRYVDEDIAAPAGVDLTDVPPNHNFYEEIAWATTNGVVNGYKDGTFRSSKNMTRAEVAAVLYRQADSDYTAPVTSPLKDVIKGRTNHYEAISWMVDEKITTGRVNGNFDPAANVTRAELATFLQRYHGVLTR